MMCLYLHVSLMCSVFIGWRPHLAKKVGNMEYNMQSVVMHENYMLRSLAYTLLYMVLGHGFFALKQVRGSQAGVDKHLLAAMEILQKCIDAGCPMTTEQLQASPLATYLRTGCASMLHLAEHTRDKYPVPRVSPNLFLHMAADKRIEAVKRERARLAEVQDGVTKRCMLPEPQPVAPLPDDSYLALLAANPPPWVRLIADVTREQAARPRVQPPPEVARAASPMVSPPPASPPPPAAAPPPTPVVPPPASPPPVPLQPLATAWRTPVEADLAGLHEYAADEVARAEHIDGLLFSHRTGVQQDSDSVDDDAVSTEGRGAVATPPAGPDAHADSTDVVFEVLGRMSADQRTWHSGCPAIICGTDAARATLAATARSCCMRQISAVTAQGAWSAPVATISSRSCKHRLTQMHSAWALLRRSAACLQSKHCAIQRSIGSCSLLRTASLRSQMKALRVSRRNMRKHSSRTRKPRKCCLCPCA